MTRAPMGDKVVSACRASRTFVIRDAAISQSALGAMVGAWRGA